MLKSTIARGFAPYRAFFAQPDVLATVAVTFIARMPVGMQSLAMVMFLREAYGSFKTAGTVVGVYFFTVAVCAPIMGRIIDRTGPRMPLIVTGVLEPISFGLLILGVWLQWPFWWVITCSALMGAFSPPITVTTRAMWRHRFADDQKRKLAFAVDSICMELNFTMGPAIIGMVLMFTSPLTAICLAWLLVTLSVIVYLRSPGLKYWVTETTHDERHWLGPLTEPRLFLVFFIVFGLTMTAGLLEVGYPAYATALAAPAFAGVLLALNSAGSAIGGLVFGALHLKAALERQFVVLLAIFGLSLLLHWPVDQKMAFAAIAFLSGFAISPAFAMQALLVSRLAPTKYTTEAFTWAATFIVCGLGAGMSVSGVLVESVSVKSPFLVGAAIMLVMAAMAMLLRPPRIADAA